MIDVELEEAHTPSDNEIKSIQELARKQYQLQQDIADLETKLKAAQEALRSVAELDLPALMVELGVNGLTLNNGWKLDLTTNVYASITKAKAEMMGMTASKEGMWVGFEVDRSSAEGQALWGKIKSGERAALSIVGSGHRVAIET